MKKQIFKKQLAQLLITLSMLLGAQLLPAQIEVADSSEVQAAIDTLIGWAPDTTRQSLFENLYQEDEIIHLKLVVDTRKIAKGKYSELYTPAVITYPQNGELITDTIEVKARGNSRRSICLWPPLKLKFSKKKLKARGFKKYNKYKLVTHCRGAGLNEQILLREFLIYKLYNTLTPESYRVQLAKIEYIDPKKAKRSFTKYGFLIENTKEMAERLGGVEYTARKVSPTALYRDSFTRMALFQYAVGNTDWHIKSAHNVKLVKPQEGSRLIAIPYDFDYSGLVDAYYAVPNAKLSMIKSVKDRLYMGGCYEADMFEPIVERLQEQRPVWEKIINDFELLNNSSEGSMLNYLEEFYELVERESAFVTAINWRCQEELFK